jgi:hypothetical protein
MGSDDDPFDPYTVVLENGTLLSPAEDLDTAIIAAAQAQALGHPVTRIDRGGMVILDGDELKEAIARRIQDGRYG